MEQEGSRATEPPWLLRPEELAGLLALGRSMVFKLVARGELPAVRIGRAVRIRRVDAERFVLERAAASAVPAHPDDEGRAQ